MGPKEHEGGYKLTKQELDELVRSTLVEVNKVLTLSLHGLTSEKGIFIKVMDVLGLQNRCLL